MEPGTIKCFSTVTNCDWLLGLDFFKKNDSVALSTGTYYNAERKNIRPTTLRNTAYGHDGHVPVRLAILLSFCHFRRKTGLPRSHVFDLRLR
jgi:hypothetical protein